MTVYKCEDCSYTAEHAGQCKDCNKPLHKTCGMCGYEIHNCTCTDAIKGSKDKFPR